MEMSIVKEKDSKCCPADPDAHLKQLNELRSTAKQKFAEGNNLQSLECYSKVLEICPQDQEALEGRLAVCVRLKLYHRCLSDIAVLTVNNPNDSKVYHLSGFVYKQVGAFEKSLSAYLKAYVLDDKHRLETANKISKMCYLMIEHLKEDATDKCINTLELLVSLSQKLILAKKFQAGLDMLETALIAHCLDGTTSRAFKGDFDVCSLKDDIKAKEFSVTSNPVKLSDNARKEQRQLKFLQEIDPEIVHNILLETSECYCQLGRLHTSLYYADECLKNALLSRNFINELEAYSKLAYLFIKSGQQELSISYSVRVLTKCRHKLSSVPDDVLDESSRFQISFLEREALLRLCGLLKEQELYQDAQKFAREYFSKLNVVDQDSLVKAYGILGELELLQGLYEESAKSYQTVLALSLQFHDQSDVALAYSNLGKVYQASGRSALAVECHKLHLKIAIALKDTKSEAIAYGSLGEGFTSQNNQKRALSCFENQLRLATANKQRDLRCEALKSIGVTYKSLRLFQHAEAFLRKALVEAQELKMNDKVHKIKRSLLKVLLTLGKSSEALLLLSEALDYLELKFSRIRGYRIVTRHPLLDELNRCVDVSLELLAELGRVDDALELAERSNAMLFHQMIEYKAFVEGSKLDTSNQIHRSLNLTELHELASGHRKLVLFYRVVKNGYMAWVLKPSHKGVAHFHWHREATGTSFRKEVEADINGYLKPRNPVASYSFDHRKLRRSSHESSHEATSVEPFESELNSNDSVDILWKLSQTFLFPVQDILQAEDLSTLEIVVVKSSFLNLIPFVDLHNSSGCPLHDLATSVQVLPCISVLGVFQSGSSGSCRKIRILGNPELENITEESFLRPGHAQPNLMEEELTDVSVLLGEKAEVGKSATREHFVSKFSSTSLLHLSTFGSHEDGVIALAPTPDVDPRAISDDSWLVTLEDIVALHKGPDVVVLNSCYGCHHRFLDLETFSLSIPLAFMIAGVKAVVMPTWSIPQKVLLASLREFYKNLSNGSSVSCSLFRTKKYLQELENIEPFGWSTFNLYGCDTSVPFREIRRKSVECSVDNLRGTVAERFSCISDRKGRSPLLVSDCLLERVIVLLHRHHLCPKFLPTLLGVVTEAAEILKDSNKNPGSHSLPYREITSPWLSHFFEAEKFLTSLGFLMKTTSSQQTILIYPHWNDEGCLEKASSVLQSVTNILSHSPALADAMRVFLSKEDKDMVFKLREVLELALGYPEVILEIFSQPMVRMLWMKRRTRRLMNALGFCKVGPVLDFRNDKRDRNALESCLKIFAVLKEFETVTEPEGHPMLSKANLKVSWMSGRANDQENKAKLAIAQRLDSIDSRYKQAMNDVKKRHNDLLIIQAKVADGKTQQPERNLEQVQENVLAQQNKERGLQARTLPRIEMTRIETLDLTKFDRVRLRPKFKVQSGSSPSCIRVPVVKEKTLPLIECIMRRDESYKAFYQSLSDMKAKKRQEVKKLVALCDKPTIS